VTIVAQLALFLSSYAPLFGVFALLQSFGSGWPTPVCIALALAGPFILAGVLVGARLGLVAEDLNVTSAQSRDGDALAYVATYLVPFAAIAATTPREQAALALFVTLIAVLYVRGGLFYINPLLAVAGYRLFQVVTPKNASVTLISRRTFLPSDAVVKARPLGDYVYWEQWK
jgi:hypothetical protein